MWATGRDKQKRYFVGVQSSQKCKRTACLSSLMFSDMRIDRGRLMPFRR